MRQNGRYTLLRLLIVCAAACAPSWLATAPASAQATPCADLQIAGISFSPTTPVQGQPATIEIKILNAGTCGTGGFVTQFKSSVFAPTGPSASVSGLAAGATTTLSLPFVFTSAGNFETVVQVDTGNAVRETNKANNLEIKAVTVAKPDVHLVIANFSVAPGPTGAVVQGRVATASITVKNIGNAPAGAFVVQWTPYSLAEPLTQTVTGLAPGASTTVMMDFTYPFEGTVTGTAVADPTHQVITGHFDNTATLNTVVEPPLPNLAVAPNGIQMHPAPAGSTSTLDVTVVNNGNNPAGTFVVEWEPGFLLPTQAQQVDGLAVGASVTLSFSYAFPFAGTFGGTVTLDRTDVIAEVSKADNTAATTFAIPAATIDLTITNLTINPPEPTQEVPATVTATVENLGNSPSGPSVTDWNPDAFGIIVPGGQTLSQQTPSIGPGQSVQVTFTFSYPQAGNFRSIAQANANNTVKETNTANNEQILNVTVLPAHIDVGFTGPIVFTPASPISGDPATATIGIRNNGPIATGPFAVELQPQAKGIPQFQFVNGLNVGESRTITFKVTYAAAGTFTATATLDPFNEVVKAAGANDVVSDSVVVVPPTATLNVTLDHLHVIHAINSSWTMFYALYNPAASCHIVITETILFVTVTVYDHTFPDIACGSPPLVSAGGVADGSDLGVGQTIPITIVGNGPLVAAAAAVAGSTLTGVAPLISFRPGFLHLTGLQQVAGLGCGSTSGGKFVLQDGGHCFDAFFGVQVVSFTGADPAAVTASAAGAPVARAAAARVAAGVSATAARAGVAHEASLLRMYRRLDAVLASVRRAQGGRGASTVKIAATTTKRK